MKVSDILRVKGNTLYTLGPDRTLWAAVQTMVRFTGTAGKLAAEQSNP